MLEPHARGVTPCLTCFIGATVIFGLAAAPLARSGEDPLDRRPVIVDVQLTASMDVPAAVASALKEEARAIWRREGVHLRWPTEAGDAVADASLRVLVLQRDAIAPAAHTWPVGELVRDAAGTPFAVISTGAARRVLAAAVPRGEPQAIAQHRLGLVLGRAVAHEVGHFLLATGDHARSGLMRAHVDVADFADLRSGGFQLDRDAGRWLRGLFARRPLLPAAPSRFSYARPR